MEHPCLKILSMKRFLIILSFIIPLIVSAQNNELSTYLGKAINYGDVFQLKYQRNFNHGLSLQTGIRNHTDIKYTELSFESQITKQEEYSQIIQSTYKSNKIDLTFLISPIRTNNFCIQIGLGLDVGFSEYSCASQSVIFLGGYGLFLDGASAWSADIATNIDMGIHFMLIGKYYFKNNLFVASQIMLNQVYDNKPLSNTRKYLNIISPLCASIGIGYRF